MSMLTPKSSAYWEYVRGRQPFTLWYLTPNIQFLTRYDELAEQSFGSGAKLAGYHLQLLGVAPQYQRKGIGRALIRWAEIKVSHHLGLTTYKR